MSKKILVIQTAFIGDVILSTALLEQIHQMDANAEISILIRKGSEGLFNNHPFIKKVYVWDKSKKYRSLYKIYRNLKKIKFESIINLQRFGTTGLLTWFLKSKEKIGFSKNPFSFCYHHKIDHKIEDGVHEVDRNAQLLKHWDLSFPAQKPKLYPSEVDFKKINTYIQKPYITIAPTSVWFTKQLPAHQWVHLINNQSFELTIYLMGAQNDFEHCEKIKNEADHPHIINLCGITNLLESAALMKEALMNFVNDSAPMHLASSMNANVTAFYCSTVPEFGFGPLSDNASIKEIQTTLDCRPCGLHGYKKCPKNHFKCGNEITI